MSAAVNPEGMRAARAVAAYEIGDPSWADMIIAAYLDPEGALAALRASKAES